MAKNRSLPTVNVKLASDADSSSVDVEHMRSLFCNPIYAGLGPFPALVDDDTWVRAAARMIEKEGSEQFLVNMLHVLRESFTVIDGDDED